MDQWVEIRFDCLPLRSVTRLDIPLDASPKYQAFCHRVKAAIEKTDRKTGDALDPFPVLRYYRVWNVEQTEGIAVPEPETPAFEPIEAAEQILQEMPNRPRIDHRDPGQAYYDPWGDCCY